MSDGLLEFAVGAIVWTVLGGIMIIFPEKVKDYELKNSTWFDRGFKSASFYPLFVRIAGFFFLGFGILCMVGAFNRL